MGYEIVRLALVPAPQMVRLRDTVKRLGWVDDRAALGGSVVYATRPDFLELAVAVRHNWDDENERHAIVDASFSGVPSEAQVDQRLEQRRASFNCLLRNLREAGGL